MELISILKDYVLLLGIRQLFIEAMAGGDSVKASKLECITQVEVL